MEDRNLRDELLAQDRMDSEFEAELARRIKGMLETRLSPTRRIAWLVSGIVGLVNTILIGFVAVSHRNTLPWQATAGLAVGSLFGVVWVAIAYSIVRSGRIIRNRHPILIAGWVWGLTLVVFIMFSVIAPQSRHHYTATVGMIDALGYLLIGACYLITNSVAQSSLQGEEQFLKLQLQLQDMTAKLERLEQGRAGQ